MTPPEESSLTFNVVWTGDVFTYLHPFVSSQLAWSRARFRFVANGCPPEQVAAMEAYRARHPDRVVEVMDVSPEVMVAHGVALDRVRAQRDDGEHFCLIDPDIKAGGPWLDEFCGWPARPRRSRPGGRCGPPATCCPRATWASPARCSTTARGSPSAARTWPSTGGPSSTPPASGGAWAWARPAPTCAPTPPTPSPRRATATWSTTPPRS
ncbi:MAG: hypothetical protein R2746_08375 [Acidimicrobiales bacterium]